jgi:response regulator NasT
MIIAGISETNRDQMARLLASSGYSVYRCCGSGSSLRRALSESEDSILIYLGLIPDCRPEELVWDYGDRIQILLIAKPSQLEDCESPDIFRLAVPTSGQAIMGAVEMLSQLHRMRLPKRAGTEKETVEQAKKMLMKQHGITEPEAHRAMQQYAMNHGMKMADYAEQILHTSKETEE